MAESNPHYVWCDLETTGTDEENDPIIELAMVITDTDLNELTHRSWVLNDNGRLASAKAIVREMHEKNGLALEVGKGLSSVVVEAEAVALLSEYGKPHGFILCGSGVSHFDRRFLEQQMPKLNKWFRYYQIDVGILRRTLCLIGREDLLMPAKGKAHRALADAQLHLAELRFIRDSLMKAGE